MTPEGKVAAALRKAAKDAGIFIRKIHFEGRIGAPDYLIMGSGLALFIETKAPGEKPRPSQIAEFKKMVDAGARVLVVDSVENAKTAIKEFKELCEAV